MLTVADIGRDSLQELLARFGLSLVLQGNGESITATYWGDSEAGVIGCDVYARLDTPVHSVLHESCHIICMTADRRGELRRDAGGSNLEESAVCYLQIILANLIEGVGGARLMADMDAWGYSFRLGNTRDWFQSDAEDAQEFLRNHGLLDDDRNPTFVMRG